MAKSDKNAEMGNEITAKSAKTAKEDKNAKNAKTAKPKKADKNKKPNIFVRFGRKVKEIFSELKRVTWPTFPQALKSTGVVLVIVVIALVVTTAINYGFSVLLQLLTNLG